MNTVTSSSIYASVNNAAESETLLTTQKIFLMSEL